MSKLAFSLIELILVIILIGIVSFLTIKLPSFSSSKKVTILNLRDLLYPNGEFYLFNDGSGLLIKDKNQTLNLKFSLPEVFVYNGEFFEKKEFGYLKNRKIVFKYTVKNGIGDSFILKNNNEFYVFKPFFIKKFFSFEEAKNFFLLKNYQPKEGEYY